MWMTMTSSSLKVSTSLLLAPTTPDRKAPTVSEIAGRWLRVSTMAQDAASQEPDLDRWISQHGYEVGPPYRVRRQARPRLATAGLSTGPSPRSLKAAAQGAFDGMPRSSACLKESRADWFKHIGGRSLSCIRMGNAAGSVFRRTCSRG